MEGGISNGSIFNNCELTVNLESYFLHDGGRDPVAGDTLVHAAVSLVDSRQAERLALHPLLGLRPRIGLT